MKKYHSFTFSEYLLALQAWRGLWQSLKYRKDTGIPDAWRDATKGHEQFTKDVLLNAGPRPEGDYELARISTAAHYGPGNIKWAPAAQACVIANTKLTDTQVRQIREQRAAGTPPGDLAKAHGISPGHVVNLCKGRTRTNAGGPIQ